jgi:hypothetical protein
MSLSRNVPYKKLSILLFETTNYALYYVKANENLKTNLALKRTRKLSGLQIFREMQDIRFLQSG